MSASGEITFVLCVLQLLLLIMKRKCDALPDKIHDYNSTDASLTLQPLSMTRLAYPCLNALKIDLGNESRLLVGACSHFTLKLSSEIGTLPRNKLHQPIQAIYGDIRKPCLDRNLPAYYIDGVGGQAQIITAEYLVQRKDNHSILYFVDGQSCIRQADSNTKLVTTIIGVGNCGNGTLDMLPSEQDFASGLVRGLEYDEEKNLFFVAIINHGLWMYYESRNSWMRKKLIDRDSISSTVSDLVRQIVIRDDTLWQRVWKGINAYNLTNLRSDGQGELHYLGTPYDYRFLSSPGSGTIDPTAKYNNTDPNLALGESDAQLSFSPNKSILMIADISQDRLFFMDPLTGNLTVFCQKVKEHFQDANDPENCTFNTLSASMWLDNGTVLIFDANRDGDKPAFRTFELEPSPTTSPTTTLGSKTISNKGGDLYCLFWLLLLIPIAIAIVLLIMADFGLCCFRNHKKCVRNRVIVIIVTIRTKKTSPNDRSSDQELNRTDQPPKDGIKTPIANSHTIAYEQERQTEKNNSANQTSKFPDANQPTDATSMNSGGQLSLPTECTDKVERTGKPESGEAGNLYMNISSTEEPKNAKNRAMGEISDMTDQKKTLMGNK